MLFLYLSLNSGLSIFSAASVAAEKESYIVTPKQQDAAFTEIVADEIAYLYDGVIGDT